MQDSPNSIKSENHFALDSLKFIFTGGPSVGKTVVLELLAQHGFKCLPETARSIIRQRLSVGLSPRPVPIEFAAAIFAADVAQYDGCLDPESPVFFDRGIPDALAMMVESDGITRERAQEEILLRPHNRKVFFFPAWEAIFVNDDERDQTFAQAVEVAERLENWYAQHGFLLIEVPKLHPAGRMEFVLSEITHVRV